MYDGPTFRRMIYSSKNLSLYSFGSMPIISMTPGQQKTTYSLNASVMLGLSLDKSRIVGHYTNGSVFIGPQHHARVVAFLNQALAWFYDADNFKDLFYHDEAHDNKLTLNKQKYPDLKMKCVFYGKKDPKSLTMSPVVIDDDGGKEGIILVFNDSQSYCLLPYYEVEALLSHIMDFSYQQEIDIYVNMLKRVDDGKFTQGFDYTRSSTHQSRSDFTKNQIQW